MHLRTRKQRHGAGAFVAVLLLCLPACTASRDFSLFGYTTAPNYDPGIRTVYVPIFKNQSFYKGIEFQLTRAVVREIEAKTPFKVVSRPENADTELSGKVVNLNKTAININQLGEIREAEMILAVELIWRDLRAGHGGEVLSQPPTKPGIPPPPGPVPVVLVQSQATYIPELGGSNAAAEQQLVNRLAVQIVSMMERPW